MNSGPDYIGIGAGRSGTSSLHYALVSHPQVKEFRGKEMHFWDQKIGRRPISWYLGRFCTKDGQVAGEITPIYYRMPKLPALLSRHLSQVKLILLLRNPIDGLQSSYQRGIHRGSFPESFEEHVDAYLRGEGSDEFFARRYYATHLTPWLKHFPREQLWVVQSEKLWADPETHLASLWEFLGVDVRPIPYPHARVSRPRPILPSCRERLSEHFRPHNGELYELIGEEYDWD